MSATTYSKDIFTLLDSYLSHRTYLKGFTPSIVDSQVLDALDGASLSLSDLESHFPHVIRWWRHIAFLRSDPVYRRCFLGSGKCESNVSYKVSSFVPWMLAVGKFCCSLFLYLFCIDCRLLHDLEFTLRSSAEMFFLWLWFLTAHEICTISMLLF